MPALGTSLKALGTKVAGVIPHNRDSGHDPVQAYYLLLSAADGRLLALMDGKEKRPYDAALEFGFGYGIVGQHRALDGNWLSLTLAGEWELAPWFGLGVRLPHRGVEVLRIRRGERIAPKS